MGVTITVNNPLCPECGKELRHVTHSLTKGTFVLAMWNKLECECGFIKITPLNITPIPSDIYESLITFTKPKS